MERQLWRLQDLRDGDGFGFWVELSFLTFGQLLVISLSPGTQSSLIPGMFEMVTSNWRKHKHSIGTLRAILNLICDIAIIDRGLLSDYHFPNYLTDRLLVLLENMVEGQSGSHIDEAIDEAIRELEDPIRKQEDDQEDDYQASWLAEIRLFRAKVVNLISRSRVYVPSS